MEFSTTIDLPWCIIGDFNGLFSPNEKLGVTPHIFIKYNYLHKISFIA